MNRRARSIEKLLRRKPKYTPRGSVLIVCEGSKTEPQYFDALRKKLGLERFVEVDVHGEECGSAPISVIDHAIKEKEKREKKAFKSPKLTNYEQVWCVIDVEAPIPHSTLAQATDKARHHQIKKALSNPCFEYWYILHFKKTSSPFHTNIAVVKSLKKHYPKYDKSSNDIFEVLYPHTRNAIKNSKQVLKETHCGEDLRKYNPSTHVHRIVEHLLAMSKKPTDK
ncbi:MAG: RloB domain-containing protein [Sedimentisphaerales bacterium]|nr:RloB domain-containing protein [Sedimentisphaerales bacterium]